MDKAREFINKLNQSFEEDTRNTKEELDKIKEDFKKVKNVVDTILKSREFIEKINSSLSSKSS